MSSALFGQLGLISALTVLPGIIVGWVYRRRLTRVQFWAWILLLMYGLFECITRIEVVKNAIYELQNRATNLPELHLFILLQFILHLLIYRRFIDRTFGKLMFKVLCVGFTLFALINAIWIDGIWNMPAYSRSIAGLLLLSISISYFYRLLLQSRVLKLEKHPLFWINAGVTIYFSGSLLIFLISGYLLSNPDLLRALFSLILLLNAITNLLYTTAIWVNPEPQKTSLLPSS